MWMLYSWNSSTCWVKLNVSFEFTHPLSWIILPFSIPVVLCPPARLMWTWCLPGNSCDCSVQVSRRFTSQGGLFFPTVLSHCLRNHIGSFQAMKLIFCLKDFCLELKTDCAKIVCSLMFLVETYQFPRSNTMGRILAPRSDDRCSDGMGLCPITQQLA